MTLTATHWTALALLALAAVAVQRRPEKCAGNCGAKSQARAAVEPPPGYYSNGFATLEGTFADPSRFALPDIVWQAGAVGRAARPTAQNGDAVAAGMAPPIEIFIQ